jgi:hypothetical protein
VGRREGSRGEHEDRGRDPRASPAVAVHALELTHAARPGDEADRHRPPAQRQTAGEQVRQHRGGEVVLGFDRAREQVARAAGRAGSAPEGPCVVEGRRFVVTPDTAELVRAEGRLAAAPSFWISRVDVVRHYRRIQGHRVQVRLESVAHIRLLGEVRVVVDFDYEMVDGDELARHPPSEPARSRAPPGSDDEP